MRVLVTGASGFVGSHVATDLARAGFEVVASARRPERLSAAVRAGCAAVAADLTDPQSLARAVEGVAAVVHLAGAADSSDAALNHATNAVGTAHLAQACRAAGAPRIVLFSSHCASRPMRDAYGESKLAGERALAESGVAGVVLRPAMIYGERSAEFTTFVRAVRRLPVIPIIGTGRTRIRPVFLDDVLPVVRRALVEPVAVGRTYEICGPEPIGFDELARAVASHLGKRRRIVHVPGALAVAGARALGAIVRHPPITVDQVMGFLQDTICNIEPARADLGFAPRGVRAGLAALFARTPVRAW